MGNTSGTLSNADLTDTAVHLKHLQKQEQGKSANMLPKKLEKEIKEQTALHTNTTDTIKNLETNYYNQTNGNTEFDKDLVKKYKDEITKINEPKIAEMETIKKMYDALVVKYGQDKIVIDRLTQLFQELQTKNDALKNDVNNYYSITNTSARKVYYEENEIDNLNTYHSVLLVTYYLLFAIYLIRFFYNKYYTSIITWIYLILYIITPWLLRRIVGYFYEM